MSEPLINNRAVRMMLALLLVIGVAIGIGMVRGEDTFAQRADASGNPADVQAPVSGTITSAPGTHHRVYSEPRAGGAVGDVSLDIATAGGTPVHPRIGFGGALQLTVNGVFAACSSADGGSAVRVDVTTDGETVGSLVLGHLSGVSVSPGQVIGPDTQIGVVAEGMVPNDSCWTGPHVHVEWVNFHQYGCHYGAAAGAQVGEGTALGRIGGASATGPDQICA